MQDDGEAVTDALDFLVDELDDGSIRIVIGGKVVVDEINGQRLTFCDISRVLERYKLTEEQYKFLSRERNRAVHGAEHVRRVEWHRLVRQDELHRLKANRIQRPPAYLLDNWLRVLVSKKSYERIYSQLIIDT